LVTLYQNGLPVRRRSVIYVVTGPGIEQLCWWRPTTYWSLHYAATWYRL